MVFLHHHQEQRETLPEAAKSTPLKLHEVWEKADLPVKAEHVVHHNIKNLQVRELQEGSQAGDTCRCDKEGGLEG